jgi:hypothetical protein
MSAANQITLFQPQGSSLRLPDRPVRVLGIDLETTNSTVAEIIWDPTQPTLAQPRCLPVHQETFTGPVVDTLAPSMVAIHPGQVVVGEGAKRHRTTAPELRLRRNKNPFFEYMNDMGIRRTYHRAPGEFRAATEIGGKARFRGTAPFTRLRRGPPALPHTRRQVAPSPGMDGIRRAA